MTKLNEVAIFRDSLKLVFIAIALFFALSFSPAVAISPCDFLSGDAGQLCRAVAQAAKEKKREKAQNGVQQSPPRSRDTKTNVIAPVVSFRALLSNPIEDPVSKAIPYTSTDSIVLADKSLEAEKAGDHALAYQLAQQSCNLGVARACYYEANYYDKGLVVAQNATTATALYVSACNRLNFRILEACYASGDRFERGVGVPANSMNAIHLFRKGCDRIESSSGSATASCAKYASLSSGGSEGPEAYLSQDPDAGLTRLEQDAILRRPTIYTKLCERGNQRACFALNEVVESYFIDGLAWSTEDKTAILSSMKVNCAKTSVKFRISYCHSANSIEYHFAKLKGFPDKNHPRWCFAPAAQYQKFRQCLQHQDGSIDSCKHFTELSGYNVANNCPYSIDYDVYGFNTGLTTVKPNQSVNIGPNEKFRWVAAHKNY